MELGLWRDEAFNSEDDAMTNSTGSRRPPEQVSDEASVQGLKLAKAQGEALQQAINHMVKRVADDGAETTVGDYRIGYAVESAEGLYYKRNGSLEWVEPQEENTHIEVAVRDGADGRFVPGLTVYATLIDSNGNEIGTHQQPFLWHPWLYHYGRNWKVPGDGTYTLRIHVEPPEFPRHDKENGQRYLKPVEAEFTGVKIKTGKK